MYLLTLCDHLPWSFPSAYVNLCLISATVARWHSLEHVSTTGILVISALYFCQKYVVMQHFIPWFDVIPPKNTLLERALCIKLRNSRIWPTLKFETMKKIHSALSPHKPVMRDDFHPKSLSFQLKDCESIPDSLFFFLQYSLSLMQTLLVISHFCAIKHSQQEDLTR